MNEEDKIQYIYSSMCRIVGRDKLNVYCNALSSLLDEYKKAKGLTGDEILDVDDFLRWIEANKYDWIKT